jgi:hypothetical protein
MKSSAFWPDLLSKNLIPRLEESLDKYPHIFYFNLRASFPPRLEAPAATIL